MKPAIDTVLDDLQKEPRKDLLEVTLPEGGKALTGAPGVVNEFGRNISYGSMKLDVRRAHEAADMVQEQYYGQVEAADAAVKQAQAAAEQARENI